MRHVVLYTRAVAQLCGDDDAITAKLKIYAQMLEDVVSRIETMDMAK